MDRNRRIDGWRGLSVLLVIAGHLVTFRFGSYFQTDSFQALMAANPVDPIALAKNIVFRLFLPVPTIGVDIFFIISGFLITTLLLNEEQTRGRVSIAAFYIRRVCRIIPAYFTFLAAVATVAWWGAIVVPRDGFIWAILFLYDLPGAPRTWWLAHTWSLAIEEQFYLAWPVIFVLLPGAWRSFALAIILGTLLVLSFGDDPLPLKFSYIAVGCLAATSEPFRRWMVRCANGPTICGAVLIMFLQTYLTSFPTAFNIVDCCRPFLLAIIFFGTINGIGPLVSIVSFEWIRRVGLVSYSLYLWQQLSTAHPSYHNDNALLLVPVAFVVPALISYFLIERPGIRLGHKLSARVQSAHDPSVPLRRAASQQDRRRV